MWFPCELCSNQCCAAPAYLVHKCCVHVSLALLIACGAKLVCVDVRYQFCLTAHGPTARGMFKPHGAEHKERDTQQGARVRRPKI